MKKYIKPTTASKALEPSNMIMATIPVKGSTTVEGSTMLGKGGDVWDVDDEEMK